MAIKVKDTKKTKTNGKTTNTAEIPKSAYATCVRRYSVYGDMSEMWIEFWYEAISEEFSLHFTKITDLLIHIERIK